MTGIGERLKELRKHLNLSQDELGAKLGLKKGALGKHEREECMPTGKMLKSLASDYNVSMDYLLCNRGTLFYDKDNLKDLEKEYKIDEDLKELISLMCRVPMVRYAVLSHFTQFMAKNKEIIKALEAESVK